MSVTADPAAAVFVRRAEALVPVLRAHAEETERNRWIAPGAFAALDEAGFFRLGVPARHGGVEADWGTELALLEQLARGCGSTAWVMAIYLGDAWIARKFPERAQDEVFGGGVARISGATTFTGSLVPVDDGYTLEGRWAFHSGCPEATWSLLCATVTDGEGAGERHFALVPTGELDRLDDWDPFGMAGTGSNTVVAHGVRVPKHRTLPVAGLDGNVQIGAVGVLIGMAEAAIELFVASLPGRAITYTQYGERREAPITHLSIAEAQLRVDTAHSLVAGLVAAIEASDRECRLLGEHERAVVLAHKAHAFRLAREAVEIVYHQSGASSIARSAPVQRIFRDAEAICQHAMHQIDTNLERYGRHLVGLEGWVFGG